jgi:Holliday junction resolvase RusA-like endonuclease
VELVYAREDEVQLVLSSVPASVQAKKSRRQQIEIEIKTLLAKVPFLFSGDVGVRIELRRLEQEQYETDSSADIDNVIKPILDSLAGPDGLIVDDNQVQHVQCYWLDHADAPKTVVTIDNKLGDCVKKGNLVFVHMGKQLYFPIWTAMPKKGLTSILDALTTYRGLRAASEARGLTYEELRCLMPAQRYFHRTRLGKYRCIELEAAKAEFT